MFTKLNVTFLSFAIFVSGSLIPQLTVLDWLFGLAYFVTDWCGYWRGGTGWIDQYPALATFCAFVFPLIISFAISLFTLKTAESLWQNELRGKLASIAFLLIVLTILFGFHSSYENRISRFGYSASNY